MAGLDRATLNEGRGLLRNVLRDARRYPLSYLVGQSLCDWGEWSVRHADILLTDAKDAEVAALREQMARVERERDQHKESVSLLCEDMEHFEERLALAEEQVARVEALRVHWVKYCTTADAGDVIVRAAAHQLGNALAGPTDREVQP